MNKKLRNFLGFAIFALVLTPMIQVSALNETEHVIDQATLEAAIADSNVKNIILDNDIDITRKLNVTNEKTIDGQNHTIKYVGTFKGGSNDNTVWGSDAAAPYNGGVYILHIYRTTATIKNIKLTGGNAAINVNGSKVTLEGTIDVSGNGFGGIEMSKGTAVTEYPNVNAETATLTNTTEGEFLPTVWVDGITAEEIIENGVDFLISEDAIAGAIQKNSNGQFQFYVKAENVPKASEDVVIIPITPEEPVVPTPEPTPTPTPSDTTTDNPNTGDPITAYIALAMLGLGTLLFSSKKVFAKGN